MDLEDPFGSLCSRQHPPVPLLCLGETWPVFHVGCWQESLAFPGAGPLSEEARRAISVVVLAPLAECIALDVSLVLTRPISSGWSSNSPEQEEQAGPHAPSPWPAASPHGCSFSSWSSINGWPWAKQLWWCLTLTLASWPPTLAVDLFVSTVAFLCSREAAIWIFFFPLSREGWVPFFLLLLVQAVQALVSYGKVRACEDGEVWYGVQSCSDTTRCWPQPRAFSQ